MRLGVAVVVLLLAAGPAAAQPERYELGRRLKAFEAAWEEVTDPAARKRAVAVLPQATTQFLSFRLGEAARTLDLARHALRSADPPTRDWEWASSLAVIPETRLLDGAATELAVTIKPLYTVKGPVPRDLSVRITGPSGDPVTAKPDKFPFVVKVPVRPLGVTMLFPGRIPFMPTIYMLNLPDPDRELRFAARVGTEAAIRRAAFGVSQVRNLSGRLAAVKKAAAEWPAADTIEKATVRDRVELLAELAGGAVPETDLPAAELLADAERMLDGEPFFTAAKPGRLRMSVPLAKGKTAPVRVFVPKGLDPTKPVPVVVALHGAGGSENLFFEGYGAGHIVKECAQRNWLLVATRGGFTTVPPAAEVLDALSKRYPIDRTRAFLVGHSMGAAQTVELLQKHPGRFAAAAALGGGGRVREATGVAGVPVFVGVGDQDFALGSARSLHKALAAAGAKATLKEYPGLEHLLVVREGLPDAFRVFDAAAK